MKVKLLLTCRHSKLVEMTSLVFRTIRVGFPKAKIVAELNGNHHPLIEEHLARATKSADCEMVAIERTRHDAWVHKQVWSSDEPTVICDTDMVFYERMDTFEFEEPWAGMRIPTYFEPFTKTISVERLHTCLLFIRPDEVRDKLLRHDARFMKREFFPRAMDYIGQRLVPIGSDVLFYDTGATLYHAVGGSWFNAQQKDKFTHLNAGTWSDILNMPALTETHRLAIENPESVRGMWREHERFYAENLRIFSVCQTPP